MTDNDSNETKIAISKNLICQLRQRYPYVFSYKGKPLEVACLEIVDALQNTDSKSRLKEIKQLELEMELLNKESLYLFKKKIHEGSKFMDNFAFTPNKLSDEDIIALCHEFYNDFVDKKECPNPPTVKIIKLGDYINIPTTRRSFLEFTGYESISDDIHSQVDEYIKESYGKVLRVGTGDSFPYLVNMNKNTFGGIINGLSGKIFIDAYYNDFGDLENSFYQRFLNWFTKSLNVLAMYYLKKDNTCYVMKKPDELKIVEEKSEIYFRYGQEEFYYRNKVKLPIWLYKTKAEDLKTEDFLLLQNVDAKAVFIEKFGIDRLAKFGTVIDSYENYPDNEMWAKSEYKIIDMHKIIPAREITSSSGYHWDWGKAFKYAPFLYMKNQTTGVYHLEGIHPRCKTLYDAIKMRYKGLKIKDFEIKDIK